MNELLDLTHDYSKPKQENYSDSLDHSACSVLISAQLCHSQKKGRRCESLLVFFSILFPDRLYVCFCFFFLILGLGSIYYFKTKDNAHISQSDNQ